MFGFLLSKEFLCCKWWKEGRHIIMLDSCSWVVILKDGTASPSSSSSSFLSCSWTRRRPTSWTSCRWSSAPSWTTSASCLQKGQTRQKFFILISYFVRLFLFIFDSISLQLPEPDKQLHASDGGDPVPDERSAQPRRCRGRRRRRAQTPHGVPGWKVRREEGWWWGWRWLNPRLTSPLCCFQSERLRRHLWENGAEEDPEGSVEDGPERPGEERGPASEQRQPGERRPWTQPAV